MGVKKKKKEIKERNKEEEGAINNSNAYDKKYTNTEKNFYDEMNKVEAEKCLENMEYIKLFKII